MASTKLLLALAVALTLATLARAEPKRQQVSAVYLNPTTRHAHRPRPNWNVFDVHTSRGAPPSLSNDDATDLVSYLAGASRGADLSRLPPLAAQRLDGHEQRPSWLDNRHRHVMVDVQGLDTSDVATRPSFVVSHRDAFNVPNKVAQRVKAEYDDGAGSDLMNEIKVSIAELESVVEKLREMAGVEASDAPAPRFATVRVNGVNPHSPEYQSQVAEVKKLMDQLGAIPDMTTSLVARPPSPILAHDNLVLTAQSVDVEPAAVMARAAASSPVSSASFSPLLSAKPVCFDSEDKCKGDTKDCSGQGSCTQQGDKCWVCSCKAGYAGASCVLYDITTPLFLTFGVGFVLIVIAFAGVSLLASAAPSDAAAAVGVSSTGSGPGTGGGSGAGTRAD